MLKIVLFLQAVLVGLVVLSSVGLAACYDFDNSHTDTYTPGWVTCGSSGTNQIGIEIKPNSNCALVSFMINESTIYNNCWVADASHNIILNGTLIGDNCTFPVGAVNLTAGSTYSLMTDASVRCYGADAWPKYSLRINATDGLFNNGGWNTNGWFDIVNITTMNLTEISCPATPTTCTLLADGSGANQSFDNNTNINLTGLNSLTGLNISLYKNGTLIQEDETPNIWVGMISEVGLNNISAVYDGNDSFDACYDYLWLNISAYTAPEAPASPIVSYGICSDNTTLLSNISYVNNGILVNNYTYTLCRYGCDNITASCYPEPFIQDLYTYGIILGFVLFIMWLWRRVK